MEGSGLSWVGFVVLLGTGFLLHCACIGRDGGTHSAACFGGEGGLVRFSVGCSYVGSTVVFGKRRM